MGPTMDELKNLITRLKREKYPDADAIFLAGSVIRGESTKTSDLDIVVAYESLPNAYRDSYFYGGWPVEAFVHDPQTLEYFISKVDAPSGVPSLAAMVSEGIELPSPTELSQRLKQIANDSLKVGPAPWSESEINSSRYMISDLVEDLRDSGTKSEMNAIATQLYSAIANHYFRSQGLWSAKGKAIPRRLRRIDETFAAKFESAFESVFAHSKVENLVTLSAEVLSAQGGFLFEGHRLDAPTEWKIG